MNFGLKTRNGALKTRDFAFKMLNSAGHNAREIRELKRRAMLRSASTQVRHCLTFPSRFHHVFITFPPFSICCDKLPVETATYYRGPCNRMYEHSTTKHQARSLFGLSFWAHVLGLLVGLSFVKSSSLNLSQNGSPSSASVSSFRRSPSYRCGILSLFCGSSSGIRSRARLTAHNSGLLRVIIAGNFSDTHGSVQGVIVQRGVVQVSQK